MTKTIKSALFATLDTFPERDLSGWQLYERMLTETGYRTYPSTLLQYAREYCKLSGATMTAIDHNRSVYHFVSGVKIAGAIKD